MNPATASIIRRGDEKIDLVDDEENRYTLPVKFGVCPRCQGHGTVAEIDLERLPEHLRGTVINALQWEVEEALKHIEGARA